MFTKTHTLFAMTLVTTLIAAGCRPGAQSRDPLVSGLNLMKSGAHEEARDALIVATGLYASNVTAHCNLGLAYWELGDETAAIASLTRAVELAEGDPQPIELLAHLLIKTGNEQGARQVLSNVEAPTATTLTLMAMAAYKAGSSDLARSYLGRALDLSADYPPALYNMALLWRDEYNTPREALSYYKRFQSVAPTDPRAAEPPQAFLGTADTVPPVAAPPLAAADADVVAPPPTPQSQPAPEPKPGPKPEPKPGLSDAAVQKLITEATQALENGNADTALHILKDTVLQAPDNADAIWALAELYNKHLGFKARADRIYTTFTERFPNDPRVANVPAREAHPPTSAAPKPTPSPTRTPLPVATAGIAGETHFRTGLAHYDNKDWNRAIASYREALRADPKSASSAYNLGLAYKAQGDLEKAAKAFALALGLEKDMPKSLYMLGLTEMQRGRNPAALAQLNRLLRVQPSFAKAHYLLGLIYLDEGRPDMATIHFERLVHLAPTDPSADHARRWLAQQKETSE